MSEYDSGHDLSYAVALYIRRERGDISKLRKMFPSLTDGEIKAGIDIAKRLADAEKKLLEAGGA